jgi:Tol biopolymer transport system component
LGIMLFLACQEATVENSQKLHSPYFGLTPTESPQMLAPGIISTALGEYNGTFSPDGKTFFYTSEVAGKGHIVYTQLQADNTWSKPAIAPFSGQYSEYDPLFAPDGSLLYFSSQRPVNPSDRSRQTHIWSVKRTANGWGEPKHVPLSGQGDYYSSLTRQGDIYFNIWNTGKILRATQTDTGYVSEALPEIINSRSDVGDPFISPEEDYLIFRAYFNEGYGRGDLYISFNINGQWTAPENLGEPINSRAHEICPYVSTDGKLFIFASDRLIEEYPQGSLGALERKFHSYDNGQSNIYYMSAAFIAEMKAKHLKDAGE